MSCIKVCIIENASVIFVLQIQRILILTFNYTEHLEDNARHQQADYIKINSHIIMMEGFFAF